MITTILSDFSRVLLFPKNQGYLGELNRLYKQASQKQTYNVLDDFELNEELLTFFSSLKNKIDLYIFTTGSVQDAPEIRTRLDPVFKKIYTIQEIGYSKTDPEAFTSIATNLGKQPNEILFIDDSESNIAAAQKANLKTIHFTSTNQTILAIKNLLAF